MTPRNLAPAFLGAALATLWLLSLHWQLARMVALALTVTGTG